MMSKTAHLLVFCLSLWLVTVQPYQAVVYAQDVQQDAQDVLSQGADDVLASYQDAQEALDSSVRILPEDPNGALASLERAANALRPLSTSSTSVTLLSGLEATFDQARAAINQRSQTNLAVQAAVIEGGLQRLLYEAALLELADNPARARERLLQLALDLNFAPERQQTINNAGSDQRRQQANVELAVLNLVQARLDGAGAQASADAAAAYRQFADAYGASIIVQDSPRLPDTNSLFESGFAALLNQQLEPFSNQVSELDTALEQARQQVLAVLNAPAQPAATPAPATEPQAAAQPAATPAQPAPEQPAPEQPAPEQSAQPAPEPVTVPVATPDEQPAPAPEQPAPTPEQPAQAAAQPVQPAAPALQDVQTALASYNVPANRLEQLSGSYVEAGLEDVSAAVNGLYAQTARILVALQQGNQNSAKDRIANTQIYYDRFLAPLVSSQDASVDANTQALMRSLLASPALRTQDGLLLTEHVSVVSRVLEGVPPPAAHGLMVSTQLVWAGSVRLAVMVVLFLLAFVPLALLNLAFGGSNRNWQLMGVALFLLLLPIMYEGLSYLGMFLADLTGVQILSSLARYSVLQNTLAQVVWAGMMLLAILLAALGLRGICVQFGLLGKNNDTPEDVDAAPASAATSNAVAANATGSETVVDWDEEF
jgi:outer membrane biosynthesis protein TonB